MYIYGIHPVEELFSRAGEQVQELLLTGSLSEKRLQKIAQSQRQYSTRLKRATSQQLDELCQGGNHQGVAARLSEFPYQSLEAILSATQDKPRACVLALAQVQDPGNLGAILRSAAALGVDAVLIPKHRAASVTPAVIRASAGMAFEIPIVEVTNLSKALRVLKDAGFWAVGAVVEGAQPLWTMDWDLKAAIVIGGEHKGIRPGVEKECDFRLQIPLQPGVESLNVAAATAIILYDRLRTLEDLR